MPQRLDPAELHAALADLPGWTGDSSGLHRSVELPSFPAAVRAVVAVADVAEELDHHPDVDLRWRTLVFHLSTHSAGGVTERDLVLARRIDDLLDGDTGDQVGAQAEAAVLAGGPLGEPARPDRGATRAVDLGPLPAGYDLHRVALSHSHVAFAPSGYDPGGRSYSRVLRLPGRGPTRVAVRQAGLRLEGRLSGPDPDPLGEEDLGALRAQLRHVLAADEHLDDLRAAATACGDVLPSVSREVGRGGGRLLRAPTAWEDLAGVLLSTGWSWAAARATVSRLVLRYGDEGPAGQRSFPTPQAVAAADEGRLAAEIRAGRRAGPLLALARAVDSGRLDPQAWVVPVYGDRGAGVALEDAEVREALLRLRGLGPWSADVALGLLGRPRGLALDGWARGKLARLLDEPGLTAQDVAERYAPLGDWAGTGCWLELTADWFGPAAPRPRQGGAA